jgi:hypothetical protein
MTANDANEASTLPFDDELMTNDQGPTAVTSDQARDLLLLE